MVERDGGDPWWRRGPFTAERHGNVWWRGDTDEHGVRSVAACVRVLFAENVSAARGIR